MHNRVANSRVNRVIHHARVSRNLAEVVALICHIVYHAFLVFPVLRILSMPGIHHSESNKYLLAHYFQGSLPAAWVNAVAEATKTFWKLSLSIQAAQNALTFGPIVFPPS